VIAHRDQHRLRAPFVLRLDPLLDVLNRALIRKHVVDVADRVVVMAEGMGSEMRPCGENARSKKRNSSPCHVDPAPLDHEKETFALPLLARGRQVAQSLRRPA
jgi:hypothetical protein